MSYKSQNKKKKSLKTLDLHGYKVADVTEALDRFLVQNQQATQVKVMTGKGSGAVKKEVIQYLKLGHYPWHYEVLPNGKTNEGVLIVQME